MLGSSLGPWDDEIIHSIHTYSTPFRRGALFQISVEADVVSLPALWFARANILFTLESLQFSSCNRFSLIIHTRAVLVVIRLEKFRSSVYGF